MMKKTITILFTICIALVSQAQNKDLVRANKYFERTFYSEAIPLYEKVLENEQSIDAIKKLADSYYYINNMDKASKNYKYLIRVYKKYVDESYYIKYANTLKALNKHKQASNLLLNYYKTKDTDKLKILEKNIAYLENIAAMGQRFKVKNLGINTSQSEFGAIQKGNSVVFSAPTKRDTYGKRFGWNGQQYLDLYEVPSDKIHLGDSVSNLFSENLNTKLHEANIVFTKDGKTAYFNRNSSEKGKRKTDDKKVTHIQLFKAELIDDEWQNITSLPFNSKEFSTEHPALSSDEKTLYFASDMPNGFGSFDIYKVTLNANGTYSEPENLGKLINTDKREQFPFVSIDHKLYFSSDGHPNFGSLDVFVSTIENGKFLKPDNVGFPINSGYDDFAFNIDADTKEGFFASNRKGGEGSDDIYKIKEEKPLIIEYCKQFITGVVTDIDTKEILPNATVILSDDHLKTLQKTISNAEGEFNFTVTCNTSFIITASKTGYTTEKTSIKTSEERNKNNDASLALKSLQAKEKEKAKNIIEDEEDIIKEKDRIVYKTDEINFDYNLWYLRRDAKKAIDKVIASMKKYPNMIIEIGTHTDIRGNEKYNLELSEKRANSVRDYFLQQDIEADRISAIGYGENSPIIKCKTEESCSEEQHEINRRCEFVITKLL